MNTSEVMALLRVRYPEKSWAFFEEVMDATGGRASRRADAIAFGLWPSQGLELHGFEVKSGRGDWIHELNRPQKAEAVLGYCDRIWVVACSKDLVKLEELPPTWGLVEPTIKGDALRTVKLPDKNTEARPLDRRFFASLMRQAARYIEREIQSQDHYKEAYEKGLKEGEWERKHTEDRLSRELVEVNRAVMAFREASGVEFSRWDGRKIGHIVNRVLRGHYDDMEDRLRGLKTSIDHALEQFTRGAKGAEDQPASPLQRE